MEDGGHHFLCNIGSWRMQFDSKNIEGGTGHGRRKVAEECKVYKEVAWLHDNWMLLR